MMIAYAQITLHVPWAQSLKDKRMVLRSLIDGARARFNLSIAEVDALDLHQSIVLGIAGICKDTAQADRLITQVVNYIESNTDAPVTRIEQWHY